MKNYMKSAALAGLVLGLACAILIVNLKPAASAATERRISQSQVESKPETTDEREQVSASADALDYLSEIALDGFEFGGGAKVAHKWTDDVLVELAGSPSEADRKALQNVIEDLAPLIAPVKIRQVEDGGNIRVWYGPDSEFADQVPGYVEGNRGYFSLKIDRNDAIYRSDVVISTEMTATIRAHLLREELTQSLGLIQDSWAYKDSMFYQGWTSTTHYSNIDKQIIKLLYNPNVEPGMSAKEVRALFDTNPA